MNQITITGNLVNSPILRRIGTQRVTNFRMAHNHSYRDASTGEWMDGGTTYIDVSCWRNLADNVSESIGKGSAVIVTGRLKSKERAHEIDGRQEKRTYFEIEASAIGPDLSRGATQALDIKRDSVQDQEGRAVEDALARAGGMSHVDQSPFEPMPGEHMPAA
jgi:single-strand DNA-binding protein